MDQSVIALYASDEDASQLLRYDFERGKTEHPEAHLQLYGESSHWRSVLDGAGRGRDRLHHLHLPVGDRRFRPTLEDLIEFLAREHLVLVRDGWDTAINVSRSRFQERQLRVAVRRYPEPAVDILRSMGYRIDPPDEP